MYVSQVFLSIIFLTLNLKTIVSEIFSEDICQYEQSGNAFVSNYCDDFQRLFDAIETISATLEQGENAQLNSEYRVRNSVLDGIKTSLTKVEGRFSNLNNKVDDLKAIKEMDNMEIVQLTDQLQCYDNCTYTTANMPTSTAAHTRTQQMTTTTSITRKSATTTMGSVSTVRSTEGQTTAVTTMVAESTVQSTEIPSTINPPQTTEQTPVAPSTLTSQTTEAAVQSTRIQSTSIPSETSTVTQSTEVTVPSTVLQSTMVSTIVPSTVLQSTMFSTVVPSTVEQSTWVSTIIPSTAEQSTMASTTERTTPASTLVQTTVSSQSEATSIGSTVEMTTTETTSPETTKTIVLTTTMFDPCQNADCGQGTCIPIGNEYSCQCLHCFAGDNCQIDNLINCSTPNYCQSIGCECIPDQCTTDIPKCNCASSTMTSRITQMSTNEQTGTTGYQSSFSTEIPLTPTTMVDPCQHADCGSGTCIAIGNEYSCQCPYCFAGEHCEINNLINCSASNYCQDIGCECIPGQCTTDIPKCNCFSSTLSSVFSESSGTPTIEQQTTTNVGEETSAVATFSTEATETATNPRQTTTTIYQTSMATEPPATTAGHGTSLEQTTQTNLKTTTRPETTSVGQETSAAVTTLTEATTTATYPQQTTSAIYQTSVVTEPPATTTAGHGTSLEPTTQTNLRTTTEKSAITTHMSEPITVSLSQSTVATVSGGSTATSVIATTIFDPCQTADCGPGTCVPVGTSQYSCQCPHCFAGDECQIDNLVDCSVTNYCSSIGCECIPGQCTTDVPKCNCGSSTLTALFTGTTVTSLMSTSTMPDVCQGVNCGQGTCVPFEGNQYSCLCPHCFAGDQCQIDNLINCSTPNYCQSIGCECIPDQCTTDIPKCNCASSTLTSLITQMSTNEQTGSSFSTEEPLTSTTMFDPCQNADCGQGTCMPIGNEYSCHCPHCVAGDNCQIDNLLNCSTPNYCSSIGCECIPNQCTTDIPKCNCGSSTVTALVTETTVTSFITTSTVSDICQDVNCGQGTCVPFDGNQYSCLCPHCFTGDQCQIDNLIDCSADNYCKSIGCECIPDQCTTDIPKCNCTSSTITALFTETTATSLILTSTVSDVCQNVDCGQGTCVPFEGTDFSCLCPQCFAGEHCEINNLVNCNDTNYCQSISCECIPDRCTTDVPKCNCGSTTSGAETTSLWIVTTPLLDPCSNADCGKGKCVPFGTDYSCQCPYCFAGDNCEIDFHVNCSAPNVCEEAGCNCDPTQCSTDLPKCACGSSGAVKNLFDKKSARVAD